MAIRRICSIVAISIISSVLFFTLIFITSSLTNAEKLQPPTAIKVINIPFHNETQIEKYLWYGYTYNFVSDHNVTFSYNQSENALDLKLVRNPTHTVLILGGFTPALKTTINMEIKKQGSLKTTTTDGAYGFILVKLTIASDYKTIVLLQIIISM